MTQPAEQLPDLYHCIDPAISEITIARNGMLEQMAVLELHLRDLRLLRTQKQAASLALAAEQIARTSGQIKMLAEAIHRGIAKTLALESRI
jgi:hypothetical protein